MIHRSQHRVRGRAPFDAAATLSFLARRTIAGVEHGTAERYVRSLRLPRGPGVVEVRPCRGGLVIDVATEHPDDAGVAVRRVRRLFDTATNPEAIAEHLSTDPHLAPAVAVQPGLRVPGSVDPFETAIRAVVGQQVSVAGARTVLGVIVAAAGEPLPPALAAVGPDGTVTTLFPAPAALVDIGGTDVFHLPMPRRREATIRAVAAGVERGEIGLTPDGPWDRAAIRDQLLAVPGIGPWTADYVAMRALGDADAFLPTDLGVVKGLWALGVPAAHADRWSPWRAYALHHLWEMG